MVEVGSSLAFSRANSSSPFPLVRVPQHLDERCGRAQKACVAATWSDELRAERETALAPEQRQRQARQTGQGPQGTEARPPGGAEPLRRNTGGCRRYDGVVCIKDIGETGGITASLCKRAEVLDRAHFSPLRKKVAQRPACPPRATNGARLCVMSTAM